MVNLSGTYIFLQKVLEMRDYEDVMNFIISKDDNGYDRDIMIKIAIQSGKLNLVKYLYEKGANLTTDVFNSAAISGNIRVLEWLYENKCPRNNIIMYIHFFLDNHRVECFEWAINKNIPVDSSLYGYIFRNNRRDLLYLYYNNS